MLLEQVEGFLDRTSRPVVTVSESLFMDNLHLVIVSLVFNLITVSILVDIQFAIWFPRMKN